MNRNEFIVALKKSDVGVESLRWAEETPGTPEELYHKCNKSRLMAFFIRNSSTEFNWPEFDRQVDSLWAEYDQLARPLWDGCARRAAQAGDKNHSKIGLLWAEYDRMHGQFWNEYECKCCDVIRKLLPWSKLDI